MFFAKIRGKSVMKSWCSGLKKKPQESSEALANLKTNYEIERKRKKKRTHKYFEKKRSQVLPRHKFNPQSPPLCVLTPQIKLLFTNRHWVPTTDHNNEIKLTFTPELLCRVTPPATLGREERLMAMPNSILKVMFAQTIRTIAITFYCL